MNNQPNSSREEIGLPRSAMLLTFVVIVGWVLCFWPARLLRPEEGVKWMTIAAICCLVPGWIVVVLSGFAIFRDQLFLMLAQMSVRLGIVGVAAIVVRKVRPEFGAADFFGWLIGFYLLTLATEVILLKSAGKKSGDVESA